MSLTQTSDRLRRRELVVTWIVDVSFWIDILANFRTAFPSGGQGAGQDNTTVLLETSSHAIAKRYGTTWFPLDVAGAIPIHLVESAVASNGSCDVSAVRAIRLNRLARLTRLIKLLRLLKMARFNTLITKIKDLLQINPGHVKLFQFITMVFFVSHFLACILFWMQEWEDYALLWSHDKPVVIPGKGIFMLNCPSPVYDDDGNILPRSITQYVQVPSLDGKSTILQTQCRTPEGILRPQADSDIQYMFSLYVLMQTITTTGYGDTPPLTTGEMIYIIIVIILGASGFGVVVGSMSSLLGRLDLRAAEFKERMSEVEDFMHKVKTIAPRPMDRSPSKRA